MKLGKLDQPEKINPDRLHDELQAALGAKYLSMDTGVKDSPAALNTHIILRLADDTTETDQEIAETIIAQHDPALLSASQQRQKDRDDAYQRFITFDFAALSELKPAEQNPVIIGLLKDIQALMRGVNNG